LLSCFVLLIFFVFFSGVTNPSIISFQTIGGNSNAFLNFFTVSWTATLVNGSLVAFRRTFDGVPFPESNVAEHKPKTVRSQTCHLQSGSRCAGSWPSDIPCPVPGSCASQPVQNPSCCQVLLKSLQIVCSSCDNVGKLAFFNVGMFYYSIRTAKKRSLFFSFFFFFFLKARPVIIVVSRVCRPIQRFLVVRTALERQLLCVKQTKNCHHTLLTQLNLVLNAPRETKSSKESRWGKYVTCNRIKQQHVARVKSTVCWNAILTTRI
jgi:hypothetical protein